MAGRHQRTARPSGLRRTWLVGGLVVVLVAVVATVTAIVVSSGRSSPQGDDSTGPCSAAVSLDVVAAPSISGVLTDIATHWSEGHPVIDGACPTVVVHSVSAANEEGVLAKPDVTVPDLWIPDSTQWVQRLRSDTAG